MSKFKTAEDDNIMSFGKFKGQRLKDVPDWYIKWMLEETNFDSEINDNTERGSIARYFKLAYKDKYERL